MNAYNLKTKKPSNAFSKPTNCEKSTFASTHKPPTGCQPKPQPNFTQYQQFAKAKEVIKNQQGKENRYRDNDQNSHLLSTRQQPKSRNVLLNNRKSHHPIEENQQRKTEKKKPRNDRKKVENFVTVDERLLGCQQHLSSHICRSGQSQTVQSRRKMGQTDKRILSPEEQLLEFERKLSNIAWQQEQEKLAELVKQEQKYSKEKHYPNYLDKQPHITLNKRAVVLDWVMLLASQLNCRRQAFANAVNLLDRYLAAAPVVPQQRLQLLGAACLMIAQKLQDNRRLDINLFYDPISEQYNKQDLLDIETEISYTLRYKLRAPTVNLWTNRLCAQWDLYVSGKNYESDSYKHSLSHSRFRQSKCSTSIDPCKVRFKVGDEESYMNFRWLAQYIDFALLDINTLQYKNRTVAAAFLYLTLTLKLQVHSPEEVATNFRHRSQLILEQTPFNTFFSNFLIDSFGFPLQQILPAVQYCSIFVILPVDFTMPVLIQQERVIMFEQYCGLQTWNRDNRSSLQRLDRTFW